MKLKGAVIKEKNVSFAVVLVKEFAISTTEQANITRKYFKSLFPKIPIVLAAQSSSGRFEYQGRNDLVKFLATLHQNQIPWKDYTFS